MPAFTQCSGACQIRAAASASRSALLAPTSARGLQAAFRPAGTARAGRGRLVCQARDKGVGSLLRNAMQGGGKQTDLAYQAASVYLRGLGIPPAELNVILDIAMNPYSVFGKPGSKQPANPHARKLTVDGDIKPVVEFLQGLGLDQQAVAGVIARHPAVLCYSVEGRLRPFVDCLVGEVKLPAEQVAAAVVQRPNILGLELGGVRRMVGYLAANGKGMDEIAQLLASSL